MLPTRPSLCAAALLLSLAGCERRTDAPPPQPQRPSVPPAPAAVAPPPAPLPPPPAAPAAPIEEAPLPSEAEVEIVGALHGAPAGTDLKVVVGRNGCTAKDSGAPFGVERTRNAGADSPFFIEVFVPQGATGHLCAYAVKDRKVVAFGAWEKNPFTMRGAGEVVFPSVQVTLQPVKPLVAAPAGL